MLERLRFYRSVLTEDSVAIAVDRYSRFRRFVDTFKRCTGEEVRQKVILDIGCGRAFPYTLLLHSLGNTVVGIDLRYVRANEPLVQASLRALRHHGLEGLGSVIVSTLQRKTLFGTLESLCNFALDYDGVDIREMSVEHMSFPDGMFDIGLSVAVFEHLPDVCRAVDELERVLKPGGIAYVEAHLFSSLSGGHRWDYANPREVPPWDHLRQRKRRRPGFLNELREEDYISAFGEKLEIIEIHNEMEPEWAKSFLTPEIRHELSRYSEEELLKKWLIIVAKRRRS
jgi:SAM-dependent methyltransferase